MAPSPTAEATRFIESSRTSPAAKTPGHAGLEGERRAAQRPRRSGAGREQVVPGDDEALVVADDVVTEPVGAR